MKVIAFDGSSRKKTAPLGAVFHYSFFSSSLFSFAGGVISRASASMIVSATFSAVS